MNQPVANLVADTSTTTGDMIYDFWPLNLPHDIEALTNLQKHLASTYKAIDWLPYKLINEIKSFYPNSDEIDETMDGEHCQLAFSNKVARFFFPGKVF